MKANEKNTGKIIIGNVLLTLGIALCLLFCFFSLYRVKPDLTVCVVEMGDRPDFKPDYFLSGSRIALDMSFLDFSKVDFEKTGNYKAYAYHGFETYEFDIKVQDTKSPEITVINEKVCLPDTIYHVEDFVTQTKDSGNVSLKFFITGEDEGITVFEGGRELVFTKTGAKLIYIYCEDEADNFEVKPVNVTVDSAPEIYGQNEFYVAKNAFINVKKEIYAYDDMDGFLTDRIESDFDISLLCEIGDHEFTYTVTDSLGLSTKMQGIVHVYNPLMLQDMVNTKTLSPFASNVAGVINPYDVGYITEDNIFATINNHKKSVVCVHYSNSLYRYRGSGYILKANSDEIIVATNKHVVNDSINVYVVFEDGREVKGEVVASLKKPDMAFIRISGSELEKVNFNYVRTVHINYNYYQDISDLSTFDLGMYCINREDGSEWLTHYGKLQKKSCYYSETDSDYNYPVTMVSVDFIQGVSGSSVVDSHGNLVCMATFICGEGLEKENYAVRLSDILDYYEIVFGERLEYY